MPSTPPSQGLSVPDEFALLAFDMEKYSRIQETKMEDARSAVDGIIADVLADCALPAPLPRPTTGDDAGDGTVLLFPPSTLARLIDPFLARLGSALAHHERMRSAGSPPVRLRVSVHCGPVPTAKLRGGNALVDVTRLRESEAAREALEAAKASQTWLAGAVSESTYRRCVHGGYTPNLTSAHFARALARVAGKSGFEAPCRLHVPGLLGAAITPYLTDEPGSVSPAQDGPATAPPPGSGSSPDTRHSGGIQFHAPVTGATVGEHIGQVHNTYPLR
ncbi:hypothetical protein GCM10010095_75860 [Streptomyces anthocyanicus]|uniref:hypothetical protein n=1 Tax=Streptomyces TaxID=1883 RepID=UPI00166F877F|nr:MULTISPECIES: hypothetical protein [Streptomyces]GGL79659.1 hypothetical protein GCM10010095_75860 [Streptomyces anthocyanicus]